MGNATSDTTAEGQQETPVTRWLALTRHESVQHMIDTLLDLPPHREFNQSELADMVNVSRASVNRHCDLLRTVGVIESVEGTSPPRYRFDAENPVSEAIIRVDGQMNRALS
jgi:DNA-binding transcriptional MocR family regulator